jgi:hypothetical protein
MDKSSVQITRKGTVGYAIRHTRLQARGLHLLDIDWRFDCRVAHRLVVDTRFGILEKPRDLPPYPKSIARSAPMENRGFTGEAMEDRLREFASSADLYEALPRTFFGRHYGQQIPRAATGAAAN